MKTQYINLMQKIPTMKVINTTLSLQPFVKFLKQKASEKNNARAPFFQKTLQRILDFEGWDKEITLDNLDNYTALFEEVYFTLSSPITNEDKYMWALGEPLTPHIIFATNAFYKQLTHQDGTLKEDLLKVEPLYTKGSERIRIIYSHILSRFYNIPALTKSGLVHSFQDEKTGLRKYYRIGFDTQFIEIKSDGPLPEIDLSSIQTSINPDDDALAFLQKVLPLDQFHFTGFSIVHLQDITAEYALEHIKDIVVNLSPGQRVYHDVFFSLKTLLAKKTVEVNLFPVLKVNNKLIMYSLQEMENDLRQLCDKNNFSLDKYLYVLENYTKNPQLIFVSDVDAASKSEIEILPLLKNMGIKSFIVIPVFFQKKLVGILEIFSQEKNSLDQDIISTLKPALPLLEQLLQSTINNFGLEIDSVIKDKFTTLQPSVQWRFNEAAWHYLEQKKLNKEAKLERVHFPEVHPLYGAIDIRNSTLERNNALRNDLYVQLDLLDKVLNEMNAQQELSLLDEVRYKTNKWRLEIKDDITPEDEFRFYLLLENEIHPFLNHFRHSNEGFSKLIDDYFTAIAPGGQAHAHQQALENTLQIINTNIEESLENMNRDIQNIFPCYFEKFRSDGIEYDIYIGQSITPDKKFNTFYLHNLRLLQLRSMADIAGKTNALLSTLPKKLETTQLIFINTNTIDISFRRDERRFDVEGAYNIRYEMMKKRIDKVHILNSDERLTQPGKIALVYFQQKDIEEYISHVHYLQEQKVLNDDLEHLDLEELQGLNGLKALRVGVKI